MILTQRYAELLWNDRLRLIILLLQPCLIAILLNIVADENVFNIYESTKSILFALSCSGIWIGMFDSIQEICKERVILKREYMANLKLPCYMMSEICIANVTRDGTGSYFDNGISYINEKQGKNVFS